MVKVTQWPYNPSREPSPVNRRKAFIFYNYNPNCSLFLYMKDPAPLKLRLGKKQEFSTNPLNWCWILWGVFLYSICEAITDEGNYAFAELLLDLKMEAMIEAASWITQVMILIFATSEYCFNSKWTWYFGVKFFTKRARLASASKRCCVCWVKACRRPGSRFNLFMIDSFACLNDGLGNYVCWSYPIEGPMSVIQSGWQLCTSCNRWCEVDHIAWHRTYVRAILM